MKVTVLVAEEFFEVEGLESARKGGMYSTLLSQGLQMYFDYAATGIERHSEECPTIIFGEERGEGIDKIVGG